MNLIIKNLIINFIKGLVIGIIIIMSLNMYLINNINTKEFYNKLFSENIKLDNNLYFFDISKVFFNKKLNIKEKIKREQKKIIKKDNNIKFIKKMKLKGIYKGGDDNFAIIEYKNEDKFINKNQKIEGFKLIFIGNDYITLEKNNKKYNLYLNNKKNIKNIKKNQNKTTKYYPNNIKKIIIPNKLKKIERLNKINYKKLKKITNNMSYIRRNINFSKDVNGNYIITYINYNSIFGKLGLKPGDKILEINGIPLKTDQDVLEIYNHINDYNYINAKVKDTNGIIRNILIRITK